MVFENLVKMDTDDIDLKNTKDTKQYPKKSVMDPVYIDQTECLIENDWVFSGYDPASIWSM